MKNYLRLVTVLIVVWFIWGGVRFGLAVVQKQCEPRWHCGCHRRGDADSYFFVVVRRIAEISPVHAVSGSRDSDFGASLEADRIHFRSAQARGVLPAIFALPAGYGDMAIGTTAAFVAWKLAHPTQRTAFIFWQVLGIVDLVSAVALGTTARLLSPHDASMLPMTVLPLSMVPTFLVPLFAIFHFICIAQAMKWNAGSQRAHLAARPPQHAAI